MNITNELGTILGTEDAYIHEIKLKLSLIKETLTDKAEHDLRLGFRTKAIIDI